MKEKNKIVNLKNLSKTNVWTLSENDVVTLLENASKDIDVETQLSKVISTIKTAFEIEETHEEITPADTALEERGFKLVRINVTSTCKLFWAIKKRAITRISDLTYENVRHITATKLLELIDKNFGGGWDSLSQSVKDIILSGFYIATSSMPKSINVQNSGLYTKKIADGFEVLELAKGTWLDLIFAKAKELEIVEPEEEEDDTRHSSSSDDNYDEDDNLDDNYEADDYSNSDDDDDDAFDEDEMTAESYRTVIEEDPENLDIADADDDEDY